MTQIDVGLLSTGKSFFTTEVDTDIDAVLERVRDAILQFGLANPQFDIKTFVDGQFIYGIHPQDRIFVLITKANIPIYDIDIHTQYAARQRMDVVDRALSLVKSKLS